MQTGFFVILEPVPKLVPDTDGEPGPVKTLDAGVDLQTEPLQLAGFQITKNKTTYFQNQCRTPVLFRPSRGSAFETVMILS